MTDLQESSEQPTKPKGLRTMIPGPPGQIPKDLWELDEQGFARWVQIDYLKPTPRGRVIRLFMHAKQKGLRLKKSISCDVKPAAFTKWQAGEALDPATAKLVESHRLDEEWLVAGAGDWYQQTSRKDYRDALTQVEQAVSALAFVWLIHRFVDGGVVPDEIQTLLAKVSRPAGPWSPTQHHIRSLMDQFNVSDEDAAYWQSTLSDLRARPLLRSLAERKGDEHDLTPRGKGWCTTLEQRLPLPDDVIQWIKACQELSAAGVFSQAGANEETLFIRFNRRIQPALVMLLQVISEHPPGKLEHNPLGLPRANHSLIHRLRKGFDQQGFDFLLRK